MFRRTRSMHVYQFVESVAKQRDACRERHIAGEWNIKARFPLPELTARVNGPI